MQILVSVVKRNIKLCVFFIGRYDGKGTVGRRNFNRFTTFVKSGGESYILGTVKVAVREEDKVYIYVSGTSVDCNNSYVG
jgi:hypothetical protein